MTKGSIGHEREITFFRTHGHNHDGENSTPIHIPPESIGMAHLDSALLDYLRNEASGSGGNTSPTSSDGFLSVPDLQIETESVSAGSSTTGSIPWTGLAVVRFVRVLMSVESECEINFYHRGTYANADREFKAVRCGNKFLWEGPWVHFDEDEGNQIHYKITNTGTVATRFHIMVKAASLVANDYANYVESIKKEGSDIPPLQNAIIFKQGSGITIDVDEESNSLTFEAVPAETTTRNRYALVPKKPQSFTSSASTSGALQSNLSSNNHVNFGTGLQWITLDYGAAYTVGRIVMVPYHGDVNREYFDARIDISTDNQNWTTVMSTQDRIYPTTQGIQIETPIGIPVQYVRLWMNGNTANNNNHLVGGIIYAISDKVGTV